jgi:hypothetical protein
MKRDSLLIKAHNKSVCMPMPEKVAKAIDTYDTVDEYDPLDLSGNELRGISKRKHSPRRDIVDDKMNFNHEVRDQVMKEFLEPKETGWVY